MMKKLITVYRDAWVEIVYGVHVVVSCIKCLRRCRAVDTWD